MSNINKIKVSGQTYNIQDQNATKTVELTQAQYDALAVKDPNTFYIITDATAGDLSNYYTKSETSGATEISTALASKADTATTYTKTEVDNAITAATSTKQDTLVSGTNIKTINNQSLLGEGNITIEGGGGGKAVSGGTNISITTGETADTINCTLPITTFNSNIIIKDGSNNIHVDSNFSQAFGSGNTINAYGGYRQDCITVEGISNSCGTMATHVEGGYNTGIYGSYSHVEGAHNKLTVSTQHDEVCSHVEGKYNKVLNYSEHASGQYNVSNKANTTWGDSGNTLFSVGNGTADNARHNAFEIRQNGDIYITKDGQDVKLQDQLRGGGGSSYTAGDGIDITNDVISVTGKVDTTAFTAHTADTVIHVTSAEKAAWNAKSDFSGDYDDLTNKPTIPTVPTSNTAFTNDAGYITSSALNGYATTGDVQTATADMATKTWVGNQGYLTEHQSLSNYYTKSETSGATEISTALGNKQDTLVSGTNIKTINNESILGSGNITIEGGGTIDQSVISGSTNAVSGGAVYTQLGGLKLQKITQSAYDNLATKDSNTLYVING